MIFQVMATQYLMCISNIWPIKLPINMLKGAQTFSRVCTAATFAVDYGYLTFQ